MFTSMLFRLFLISPIIIGRPKLTERVRNLMNNIDLEALKFEQNDLRGIFIASEHELTKIWSDNF